MAKVFLWRIGAVPPWHDQFLTLTELASRDEVKRHSVVARSGEADIIVAVVNGLLQDTRFQSDSRVRVYCSYDTGLPLYPGMYPSLPNRYCAGFSALSGPYLHKPLSTNVIEDLGRARDLLFSFAGNVQTSPIRRDILNLKHPQSLLQNTGDLPGNLSGQSQETYAEFRKNYLSIVRRSKFSLCPRGVGASSIRLFESMALGCVPVIVSDEWSPPPGIDWEQCSLRVKEKDISQIPRICEELEPLAGRMGNAARMAWLENFSDSKLFNYIVDQMCAIEPCSEFKRIIRLIGMLNTTSSCRVIFRHATRTSIALDQ